MDEKQIIEMVKVPEWKSILYDLIKKDQLDPWNIDIEKLASLYIEELRRRKEEDLVLPANVVLASSILLHFKSHVIDEWLRTREDDNMVVEGDLYLPEADELPNVVAVEEVIEKVVPPKTLTKKPLSIDELIEAVEEVMKKLDKKVRDTKEVKIVDRDVEKVMTIEEDFDMEEFVKELYNRIKTVRETTLSELAPKDPVIFIRTLLGLLFLATEGKVRLLQENMFGEIIIKVV